MPTQPLRVTPIQTTLAWENKPQNLQHFDHILSQIVPNSTDLVILPEMFTTGFTMNAAAMSEPFEDGTLAWIQDWAAKLGAAITGSFIASDQGKYYNRAPFVCPSGQATCYDKRHLFRMADEEKHFAAGNQPQIVSWKSWNICLQICYDLRFPVWSRNVKMGYDLLIYVANWPAPRVNAWDTLLRARAIENLSYAVGVNRIGEDGKGIKYVGHSAVIDPKGQEISYLQDKDTSSTSVLDHQELVDFREKFPTYLDADQFELKL